MSSQQNLGSVKHLIDRRILDFTDQETLLHEAVISQNVHVLEPLLHFGLDPDTKDFKGRTPLGLAAKHGHVEFVKILTAREDLDVNSKNYKSMTPLLLAVKEGREDVRILVDSTKADLRLWDASRKSSLHLAVLGGHIPILLFLLDFRFLDTNDGDDFGQTALHLAAGAGNCLAVRCLLEDEHVDVNAQDYGGETALHAAVTWEQLLLLLFIITLVEP